MSVVPAQDERGRALADDKSSSDSLTPQIPIPRYGLLGRIGLPAWTQEAPLSFSIHATRGLGLPLIAPSPTCPSCSGLMMRPPPLAQTRKPGLPAAQSHQVHQNSLNRSCLNSV